MPYPMPMMTPVEAQAPITDEDGEIKECTSSGDCGSGYCVQGQKFCCPKPGIIRYNWIIYVSALLLRSNEIESQNNKKFQMGY